LSEQLLPHRHQQQRQFRGDDREQMMTARRAAEALFTPKPDLDVQPVPDPAPSIKVHKPRVLPVLPPAPIRQEDGQCVGSIGAGDSTRDPCKRDSATLS